MNATPSEPGLTVPPPPGWYEDPETHAPRWWDGERWGPVSSRPPSDGGSTVALSVICHLGVLLFAVLLPLIIYLTAARDDSEVRHHAREAVNFQITVLILWIVGFAVAFGSFGSELSAANEAPPLGFIVVFGAMFVLFFVAIGFAIYGAVQAGRGRRWRYPVSLRLVGRSESRAREPSGYPPR